MKTHKNFPIRFFKRELWHVGTLDRSLKRSGSHEGSGLSVSTVPDAWERINRGRTAGDRWALTKTNNRFLDCHRLNKAQKEKIKDWGLREGYIEAATLYRYTWFDDELDYECSSDHLTAAEAQTEAGEDGEIEEVPGIVATASLCRATEETRISLALVPDFLMMVYAEKVLSLDGVWWQDRLDVLAYSAPRGVIFNSVLPTWSRRNTTATDNVRVS